GTATCDSARPVDGTRTADRAECVGGQSPVRLGPVESLAVSGAGGGCPRPRGDGRVPARDRGLSGPGMASPVRAGRSSLRPTRAGVLERAGYQSLPSLPLDRRGVLL